MGPTRITGSSLDAVVFPHQNRLVIPVGETQVERNGSPGTVTGFPSIVVLGGFSKPTPTATLGVPIGIEFLGRPFSEPKLVPVAHAYEQASRRRVAPKSTPGLAGETFTFSHEKQAK